MACCGNCFCCQCCCREGETRTPEELTILGEIREEDDEILPRKDYESLDYDRCINEPYVEVLEGMDNKKAKKYEAVRWMMMFAIGVAVGLVGLFVDFFVRLFTKIKFTLVGDSVEKCSDKGCLSLSLLELLAFNMTFVFIASVLVLIEPVAAGSGIPEIKSYLNGVKIPGIVRLRTFLCKAAGVLFSVAGGLFVGKEGPMIHSGAIVGAGLPQFQSITFKRINFDFPYFRSDRDKRDFVSAGAAAGVAAAFGAPIGGTLFSLEEGSSFWNQALTWKVLFCSMSATFTLNFFRSGINFNKWGSFQLPGLLNFGEFKCPDGDKNCHLWTAVDLAFFVLMGVMGGLLGALFNCMNKGLAKYRIRHIHPKAKFIRVLESLLVSMVTTVVIFVASMVLGECRDLSSPTAHNTTLSGSEDINSTVRQFFCTNKTYNDMATLFFNPQEAAIHQLFHQEGTFSPVTLSVFFLLYFLLACWTYGVSLPSGLFVPSLLCGAAFGRLVANILKVCKSWGYPVNVHPPVCLSVRPPQSATQPRLSYAEMTEDYPRYPDIHDLDLALLNPRMIVDVTPYMNPCPYTVSPNTRICQVFNLFRTMGLRHLPVVNAVGEIVGIITRHNLTHEFLVAKLRQHYITI
ncbi:chloride transport protein 6 [Micropterus dolomieu]|uniref:chloride transport protein 6 n=1 Tax=Micropterus dolomieu TaxID=147949 RepID=UPI001E8E185C|nr:chloride transport protein 6 [Micropterus dolomieu]